MINNKISKWIGIAGVAILVTACSLPALVERNVDKSVPNAFGVSEDTTNMAAMSWDTFFKDPYLKALIDSALNNNQELNIMLQEIRMGKNEVQARRGEFLPFLNLGGAAGVEKVGRYTSQGANDANTEIEPGKEMPDPLGDIKVGVFASWEIDIWRKLRNAKDAAVSRYLASMEGRNFMITHLVSEISTSYYELLALDNQLSLVREYIEIQNNALKTVRLQKQAGEVTELAVRKFEAEVLNTQSLQYDIIQKITETENQINFLLGRYPQPIQRDSQTFDMKMPDTLQAGIPSQLLENRPDIRQAELNLEAAKLDVRVAKAEFYPSLNISAGVGLDAFNPAYLIKAPESMLYSLAGDMMAPLINRKAIKAAYSNANAQQIQVVYDYERTILNAYIEVANQLSKTNNLKQSYDLKLREVKALNEAIQIANNLFVSAKADYIEVLTTQRDALESRFELIEYKKQQLVTLVDLYRSLGGGWK